MCSPVRPGGANEPRCAAWRKGTKYAGVARVTLGMFAGARGDRSEPRTASSTASETSGGRDWGTKAEMRAFTGWVRE